MGHESSTVTEQRYVHLFDEERALDAVRLADPADRTRSDKALEVLDRFPSGRRGAQVLANEGGLVGPVGRFDLGDGALDVERRAPELDVVRDERPERGDVVLVRHPDRAGVGEALAAELHVRVAGDDEAVVDARECFVEALLRRSLREDRAHVVARRSVAVEDTVELDRRRPAGRPGDGLVSERIPDPLDLLAIAVPAHELSVDAPHEGESFSRQRTEEEVAAKDDGVDGGAVDLGEYRLERVRHSVDVVERRDAH